MEKLQEVKTYVYVLDMNGQPLMPTTRYGKVHRLLKQKKAKVIKKCPFTIKLLYEPKTKITQVCNLGVDTGSAKVGFAVYEPQTKRIMYQSQVELRNDIKDKMDARREYRKQRRNLKTRYRKARFLNRKNSIKKDRFSPTMISKFQGHIREIEFIKKILPITSIILETGTFDPALMKNPNMNRHWGYQKGPNYGFANTHAKVLNRDNYECQLCHGKHKDSKLEVHHIVFRSQYGSDDEGNLITLCHTCHRDLHQGKIKLNLKGKLKGQLKHATQMNSIRIQLLKIYPEAIETFGFITKANRQQLGLEKDHYIDACVIASGGNNFIKLDNIFYKKVVGKDNRSLSTFRKVPIQIPKGKINGFRRYDKVKYQGQEYFVAGRISSGYNIIQDIFGNKPNTGYKTLGYVKTKELIKIQVRKGVIVSSSISLKRPNSFLDYKNYENSR